MSSRKLFAVTLRVHLRFAGWEGQRLEVPNTHGIEIERLPGETVLSFGNDKVGYLYYGVHDRDVDHWEYKTDPAPEVAPEPAPAKSKSRRA